MTQTKWTLFWDMHSGGRTKEGKYDKIYIEAPENEAKIIFYNRFGHNPDRVSCTCCGSDYSIDESDSLEQASGYHRGCAYAYINPEGKEVPESEGWQLGKGLINGCLGKYVERKCTRFSKSEYVPLSKYLKNETILVIYEKDIKAEERIGEVPEQGYVWRD